MGNKKNPVLATALVAILLLFLGGAGAFFFVNKPEPRMDDFSYAQKKVIESNYSKKADVALDLNKEKLKDLKVPQNIEKIKVVAKPIKVLNKNINKDSLPKDDNELMEPGQTNSNTEKNGFLDSSVIKRVVRRHINEIKYCYEKELIKNPSLKGKVVVYLIIQTNGKVSDVKVSNTTLKDERVESCIIRRINRWVFPKLGGGGIVKIKYPFIFH